MGVSHIKLSKRAASKVIKLGVVGFELQSKSAIDLFFMQHQEVYRLVSTEQAEVLIVDMEHPAVKPVIEAYKASRPIIAVTATENQFDGFETLTKPLEGKRLINAIKQAVEKFVPANKDLNSPLDLSNEGEKAFQEYQKRVAAGRQAMSDYSTLTTDRDEASQQVHQRFQLNETADARSSSAPVSKKPASPKSVVSAPKVVTPVQKKAPEKKPQDVKAKLSYQMVYECCGNTPDVNMHEPNQRRRVFFKEDSTLLAILLEVISEGEEQRVPVEVTGLPGTLAYLPEEKDFLFDFSADLLVPLALTRFGYQELTLKVRPDLNADRPSVAGSKVTVIDSDKLIWKLALWTSKGRLNRSIDPEKPLRLSKKLDFNQLLPIPHATTIGSLWGRHSLSALEVVKVLKIHQRYVFSFMTAAFAVGAFK